ncbi:NmrA family NAD(P)-binding protein [Nocardia crassostreae]|uniref:NmrA family NAD(P)-binding protein n=1 Tax=Nocardia crassostreae TaxID=53428 RepID=UPI00082B0ABA|nr:NmrA family NAD(P)-binding protein [Nocardia crassostreae]
MPEVLVLGSSGTTGSRVANLLRWQGVTTRLATRTPNGDPLRVGFDWHDGDSYDTALHSVSAVYLVAPVGVRDPVPLVEPFLRAARRHGVRRVVALGSSAVPEAEHGMGGIHRLVREIMPEWAVLRPSWFMQNFTGAHALAAGVRAGEIVTATGDGRVAFVDAADIAAVAVRALTDGNAHDTEHLITGPRAISYAEAAAIITGATGRAVVHRSLSAPELTAHWIEHGLPADFAAMLAGLDDEIRGGAEDRVADTVERITGRPPRGFAEFVAEELQ